MLKSFSWDQYFMTMAYLASMKSKDPSTRVGAVIIGPNNEIRSTGYNGMPRGYYDMKSRYEDREHKLLASNHAEENAILHCALNGISSLDSSMYVPWIPCSRCAKAIVQSGIKKVIYDHNFIGNKNARDWQQSMDITAEMFDESGVALLPFKGKMIRIEGLYDGKIFDIPVANPVK